MLLDSDSNSGKAARSTCLCVSLAEDVPTVASVESDSDGLADGEWSFLSSLHGELSAAHDSRQEGKVPSAERKRRSRLFFFLQTEMSSFLSRYRLFIETCADSDLYS